MIRLNGTWSYSDLKKFFEADKGKVYYGYLGIHEYMVSVGYKVFGHENFKIQAIFSIFRIYTTDVVIELTLVGYNKGKILRRLYDKNQITNITGQAILNLIKETK